MEQNDYRKLILIRKYHILTKYMFIEDFPPSTIVSVPSLHVFMDIAAFTDREVPGSGALKHNNLATRCRYTIMYETTTRKNFNLPELDAINCK